MRHKTQILVVETNHGLALLLLQEALVYMPMIDFLTLEDSRFNYDVNDIGLNSLRVDLNARDGGKFLSQEFGISIVNRQLFLPVHQTDQSAGAYDACLAHRTTEHLAVDLGSSDFFR